MHFYLFINIVIIPKRYDIVDSTLTNTPSGYMPYFYSSRICTENTLIGQINGQISEIGYRVT